MTQEQIEQLRKYYKSLEEKLDCGDGSCHWKKSGGMRTNGGCSCFRDIPSSKRVYLHTLLFYLKDIFREEQ